MGPAGRRHAAGHGAAAGRVRRLPASLRQQLRVLRDSKDKEIFHDVRHTFGAAARWRSRVAAAALPAGAQTKIDFFFPVPVDGKLAREMTRLVKVYNDSQKEVDVTAVYTGSYDDTKLKAQAAAKAGKPPAVVLMSANFVLDLKLAGDIDLARADAQGRRHDARRVPRAISGRRCTPTPSSTASSMASPSRTRRRCSTTTSSTSRRRASIRSKPPQTWAELVDAAKKLTKARPLRASDARQATTIRLDDGGALDVQRRPLLQRGVRRRGLLRHALDAGRRAASSRTWCSSTR